MCLFIIPPNRNRIFSTPKTWPIFRTLKTRTRVGGVQTMSDIQNNKWKHQITSNNNYNDNRLMWDSLLQWCQSKRTPLKVKFLRSSTIVSSKWRGLVADNFEKLDRGAGLSRDIIFLSGGFRLLHTWWLKICLFFKSLWLLFG